MKRTLAFGLALLLAGCGGGGGGGSLPGASKSSTQSKAATGSVVISIPVASGTTQALARNARYPQFVSPNASSVALSINGGADVFYDVSATSSLCTTVSNVRNCTLAFGAPAGADTFAFLIWSGINGSGTQLASAISSQTIAAGTAFNFTVALNAAVGTLVANVNGASQGNCPGQPSNGNSDTINEGCSGGAIATITVMDPSGAVVTGTTPYASAITITASDPSLAASPSTVTAPGEPVTLTYNGAAFAAGVTTSVTFNLAVSGVTIPLTIPVRRSYLYIANSNAPIGTAPSGNGNITVYTFGASGSTAPVRTVGGGATGITTPTKPLVDAAGNLYVLDNNIPVSTTFNPTIRVFAPGATTGAPIRQITNIGGVSGNAACSDMVFDPTGQFIFASCGLDVFVFPILSNTTASSAVVASFENDSSDTSNGLAFDQSGDLYVADSQFNAIFAIPAAEAVTSGGFHLWGGPSLGGGISWNNSVAPFFLAVDDQGTLYAPVWLQTQNPGPADNQAELAMWSSTSLPCTNCGPTAFLTGAPFTTQHAQAGIALDAADNVYVDNPLTNLVTEFSRATIAGASLGTTGTVLRTLNNNSSGATGSLGMFVGP